MTGRGAVLCTRRAKVRLLLLLVCIMACFPIGVFFLREDYDFRYLSKQLLTDKVRVNTDTADQLAEKIKILCFVTTRPGNEDRAVAVNVTWLKRCTRHVFVTSSPLTTFREDEVLHLANVPEGRGHLTAKTMAALDHFYKHDVDTYDWFLKADDDVFIIVENLRLLLSRFLPDDPVYLGHHFRTGVHNGYMSGGAGYVISRQALRMLGERGMPQNGGVCKPEEPDEDLEVGKCLEAVGVKPYSTLDRNGRETFHPDTLSQTLFSNVQGVRSLHWKQAGPDCCSQLTISFHYVTPQTIYTLDMLLYHISVYGRHGDDVRLSELLKSEVELVPHKTKDEVFYP